MTNSNYQKPRIAHIITQAFPFAGAQRNTLITVIGLSDAFVVALVAGNEGPLLDYAREGGVYTKVIQMTNAIQPWQDLVSLFRIIKFLRRGRFDIVHTHSTKAGVLGRMAAWLSGVRIIIHTVHTTSFLQGDNRLRNWILLVLERICAKFTTKLIAVGRIVRDEIVSFHVAKFEKVVVIYSGIDFKMFNPDIDGKESKARLGIPPVAPVITAVGRLSEQKGHRFLLEALPEILKRFPNLQCLLVGDGELREALQEQAQRLGISTNVRFLGERKDIAEILAATDVYVQPSLWEGVSRALTEALYMKRPVVVSGVNGIPEFVQDGFSGFLVPPRRPDFIASRVLQLLEDSMLAERMGMNAHELVKTKMDARRMVEDIHYLYQCLLDELPKVRQ